MSLDSTASQRPLRLPLARHEVNRDDAGRATDENLTALAADPRAVALVIWQGRALLAASRDALALRPLAAIPEPAAGGARHLAAEPRLYLGRSLGDNHLESAGTPVFAVSVTSEEAEELAPDGVWATLRDIATRLGDRDAGLFTEAQALYNWHRSHGHCPRCGTATVVEKGGWVRRCPEENIEIFPRTDPAVIVAITDDADRLLLGSNAAWPAGRYSVLAGFVEAGESLEAAVEREMLEESGLSVVDAHYRGSQPWPFPASIMLGFSARVAPGTDPDALRPDGVEILELRWFTREELAASLTELTLPASLSIARALIEDWYGGPLEDSVDEA